MADGRNLSPVGMHCSRATWGASGAAWAEEGKGRPGMIMTARLSTGLSRSMGVWPGNCGLIEVDLLLTAQPVGRHGISCRASQVSVACSLTARTLPQRAFSALGRSGMGGSSRSASALTAAASVQGNRGACFDRSITTGQPHWLSNLFSTASRSGVPRETWRASPGSVVEAVSRS